MNCATEQLNNNDTHTVIEHIKKQSFLLTDLSTAQHSTMQHKTCAALIFFQTGFVQFRAAQKHAKAFLSLPK